MKKIGCIIMIIVCTINSMCVLAEENVGADKNNYDVYSLYYNRQREINCLEKSDRLLKGAYILSDSATEYDIKTFEDATAEHNIYIYHMEMGEKFPLSFVINCVAKGKTPYVIVEPSDKKTPFEYNLLRDMAMDFGRFDVPMLLGFCPKPISNGYDSEGYIEYFRTAREVFTQYAPNASFVWSVSAENAVFSTEYYPGDEYVDWVGLDVYENINKNGIIKFDSDINVFADRFQNTKPMLLNVAVAHISTLDYKYYVSEATKEISRLYSLAEKYPAIRAINYMDYSELELLGGAGVRYSYLITDNEDILKAYSEVVAKEVIQQPISRHRGLAFVRNGSVYAECGELECIGLTGYDITVGVNGSECVELNNIADLDVNSKIKRVVLLSKSRERGIITTSTEKYLE